MRGEAVRGSLADARRVQQCGSDGAEPMLLNLRDAAQTLAVSARSLWEWTKAGRVPHVRLGRRLLYAPDDLRRWVQSQRQGPGTAGDGDAPKISQETT